MDKKKRRKRETERERERERKEGRERDRGKEEEKGKKHSSSILPPLLMLSFQQNNILPKCPSALLAFKTLFNSVRRTFYI